MAGFPAHVDSSLLTLAMRANVSGLSVRDWSTGKYLRIERRMADDEAVPVAGDALVVHLFPRAARVYASAGLAGDDPTSAINAVEQPILSVPR